MSLYRSNRNGIYVEMPDFEGCEGRCPTAMVSQDSPCEDEAYYRSLMPELYVSAATTDGTTEYTILVGSSEGNELTAGDLPCNSPLSVIWTVDGEPTTTTEARITLPEGAAPTITLSIQCDCGTEFSVAVP